MIYCDEIQEYLQFTKDFPEKVSDEVHDLINNICIPTLNRNDIIFDKKTYENCIKYCEKNYYKLFPYQKFIYAFVFMYDHDDFVVFNTFFIEMGRGNGKDGMIMPLLNFLQTPLYGVDGYNIDIVCNNNDQSKDSFNVVYEVLENNKSLDSKFIRTKELIINKTTRSYLKHNTSNASTKDGKKSGCVLFNEMHAYEDYKNIGVFTSGFGKKRHSRIFIITTNGYVRGGPLDDYESTCFDILKTGDNELGYFPFICRIKSEEEVDIEDKWIKANPSWDYLPNLRHEMKLAYLKMKKQPNLRSDFVTKRLNYPARDEKKTVASWENIQKTIYVDTKLRIKREIPDLKNRLCVCGVDASDIRDFCSVGLLFFVNDKFVWKQHTWICRNSPFFKDIKFPFRSIGEDGFEDFEIVDTPSINVYDVVKYIYDNSSDYFIQKIICDNYRFNLLREAFDYYGFSIENKDNPNGMVRMIRNTNSIYTLTAPLILTDFTDERLNFCNSRIMLWYTNNTGAEMDKLGNYKFFKIEPKLRKNDGFSAFVNARSGSELIKETIFYI